MPVIKLTAQKFEEMAARRGRLVKWQQAVTCTCRNISSGQPRYDCAACKGRGYTFEEPLIEKAVVMSVTANKDFEEFAGVFDVGDAVMIVPKRVFSPLAPPNASGVTQLIYERDCPMYDVGMYDLITLLDDDYRTTDLLQKGTDIFGRPADTLLNEDVVEVLSIRVNDEVTGEMTEYEQGVDYVLDGHRIDWIGDGPEDDTQYSVTYKHRPVFTVLINLPKPRHQDGQDMPRYAALRYRAGGFGHQ